jgi:hypothetical protein
MVIGTGTIQSRLQLNFSRMNENVFRSDGQNRILLRSHFLLLPATANMLQNVITINKVVIHDDYFNHNIFARTCTVYV